MSGFLFPNEGVIEWDLLITIYPFITGLVAGAFIVSSLYHVFGIKALKPVARFSLVTALAFLLVAPMPLTIHLGRPERAFEMFLSPNLTSAMSGFGYIWGFYLLLLLIETWLVFRPDIVGYVHSTTGWKRKIYQVLALGIYEIPEKAAVVDKKLIKILAFIGIPAAFLLHGYVGFIFGAVKANPWWSTPLMPIIFLVSAIVSGIALLILMYVVVNKIRRVPVDNDCVRSMALWLGGFLSFDLLLEGLEVFSMFYESEESWGIISQLIRERLAFSYLGIQFVLGSVVPLVVLAFVAIFRPKPRTAILGSCLAGSLVVIGVFAMRWNVVIGGQLISKSLRGFADFTPPLFGTAGILTTAGFLLLPLLIFAILCFFIPPWHDSASIPVRGYGWRDLSKKGGLTYDYSAGKHT